MQTGRRIRLSAQKLAGGAKVAHSREHGRFHVLISGSLLPFADCQDSSDSARPPLLYFVRIHAVTHNSRPNSFNLFYANWAARVLTYSAGRALLLLHLGMSGTSSSLRPYKYAALNISVCASREGRHNLGQEPPRMQTRVRLPLLLLPIRISRQQRTPSQYCGYMREGRAIPRSHIFAVRERRHAH
jgi:hypothetical protein